MNMKPKTEIIPDEEVNLYDYWKALVKRKKTFFGIFLVPLVLVIIISLGLPRYYRGESEITNTLIPAPKIVNLIGEIDDTKKVKIFADNAGAIDSVLILPSKSNSNDKINIIIEAKTAGIIPRAFKDIFDYIGNLPEIKETLAVKKEETDLRITKLIEAKKATLLFLSQITDMIKRRQISIIYINPADLIKKDADLSIEIMNLQHEKVTAGTVGLPSITKQPSNALIRQIIIITVILSLFTGIFVCFFLDYLERMKAREKK
jgi:hypothetical protein